MKSSLKQVLVVLPLIALCGMVLIIAIPLFAFGYVDAMLHGPKVVMEVPSPDGSYLAYVEDAPSIDGPNQSLLIERKDKTRFLGIADLTEDVDSIITIAWSPDSSLVVYHSRCYLTAVYIPEWRTVRIYLGQEWVRREPSRRTTFCGAQPMVEVAEIGFPEPGTLSYRIKGEETVKTVTLPL